MAVPERIYLQIGENCEEVKADFGNGEVTWSVDQIYSTDIEYVQAATIARLTAENERLRVQLANLLLRIVTPEAVDAVADSLDTLFPNDPNPEVQIHLRKGAEKMREAALAAQPSDAGGE